MNAYPFLKKIEVSGFMALKDVSIEFGKGINVLIGANATGKTTILKLLYLACINEQTQPKRNLFYDISSYFFATYRDQWNIINKDSRPRKATIRIDATEDSLIGDFEDRGKLIDDKKEQSGALSMHGYTSLLPPGKYQSIYIPAKEVISHIKYFISTYEERKIYFEREFIDILYKIGLGPLRNLDNKIAPVLLQVQEILGGTVEEFFDVYHIVKDGFWLEMTLVAEGLRKFAMLWLLLNNGSIKPGTILLWDEPEANLNPKLMGELIEILLMLQRIGVQVFLATHSYVILKELDLRAQSDDSLQFITLYRDPDKGDIVHKSFSHLYQIDPNPILDVYSDLYDRQIDKSLGDSK